jgi:hypothetical protein
MVRTVAVGECWNSRILDDGVPCYWTGRGPRILRSPRRAGRAIKRRFRLGTLVLRAQWSLEAKIVAFFQEHAQAESPLW